MLGSEGGRSHCIATLAGPERGSVHHSRAYTRLQVMEPNVPRLLLWRSCKRRLACNLSRRCQKRVASAPHSALFSTHPPSNQPIVQPINHSHTLPPFHSCPLPLQEAQEDVAQVTSPPPSFLFPCCRLKDMVLKWLPVTHNQAIDGESPALGDSPIKSVLRSKGFMWMSNSHTTAYYWSHAGQHFEIRE
eukprot:364852-Chlamydomonas_euryale.AAC.11